MATTTESVQPGDVFAGDGEVAQVGRERDWAKTMLGLQRGWSQTLRTTARLVLNSRLPMTLGWGQELVQIYNDAYLPILGDKHPNSLGKPVREVYAEIWEDIRPLLDSVLQNGEAIWEEDRQLMIERHGFRQEAYFTFSYSPVRCSEGEIVGVLSSAVETTDHVIERRRAATLRDIHAISDRTSFADVLCESRARLDEVCLDIPTSVLYCLDGAVGDVPEIDLVCAGGVHQGSAPPASVVRDSVEWDALDGEQDFIEVPMEVFDQCAWLNDGRPGVAQAVLLPVCERRRGTYEYVAAVLIGLSEWQYFDESYREFISEVRLALNRKVADVRFHEMRLAEADDRYRAVFEHALDAMLLTSPQGPILAANPAACDLLGYSEDELCGLARADVVDISDERVRELVNVREATGQYAGEIDLIHRDGHLIPCEVSSNVYRDVHGNERTSMVVRDIRDRLKMESDLRQAQKLDVVGKLAGGIAHDFNNLLTVIRSAAQFLYDEVEQGSDAAEDLRVIEDASIRASALTRRLLAFSRTRSVRATQLNLSEVIREIDVVLRRLIGEDIELVTSLVESPWLVYADAQGIEQILLNLAVNARDAMPDGGELTLDLARAEVTTAMDCEIGGRLAAGRYMLVTVADSGGGIADDDVSKIFEPFYTTRPDGTGLGLATVADVLGDCDGHLRLQNTPGKGARFEIYLPVSRDTDSVESAAIPAPVTDELASMRVLVVEDQPLVRRATGRMLSTVGMDVSLAADGEEALAKFGQAGDGFDIVISDVVMPHMSGPEVVRKMRSVRPNQRFLFVSGYPDSLDLTKFSDLAVEVLMKPFDTAQLAAKVREVLAAR